MVDHIRAFLSNVPFLRPATEWGAGRAAFTDCEHHGIRANFFVTIVSFHERVVGWNAYLSRARDSAGVIRGNHKLEGVLSDFARAGVAIRFDRGRRV